MHTLKVNESKTYDIVSVEQTSSNTVKLVFEDISDFSSITIDTLVLNVEGSDIGFNLSNFNTAYEVRNNVVILSNDGRIFSESDRLVEVEELKKLKIEEIHVECKNVIYRGVDVDISTGIEHFSLTTEDQMNLFGKQMQVQLGYEQIEYHGDGTLCKYYPTADMAKIIEQAVFYVSYHTTYCNSLLAWAKSVETKEELEIIFYGADIPEEFQSDVLKSYLIQIGG